MLLPDYLVAACGSEVYEVLGYEEYRMEGEWAEYITRGNAWDVDRLYAFFAVEWPELIPNRQEDMNRFKGEFMAKPEHAKDEERFNVGRGRRAA